MERIAAVDIGGSKIELGLVRAGGEIERTLRKPLPPGFGYGLDYLRGALNEGVEQLLREAPGPVDALGFAVPAPCDSARGVLLHCIWSGITNWNLREEFSPRFGLPVFAENDANACAVAERRFGCCRDSGHFLWMTVSTGCGGALFLDGRLYRGPRFTAGEVGHVIVRPDSAARCGCGLYGDLEMEASGNAIGRKYRERKKLPPDPNFRSAEVGALAWAGDELAAGVFREAGFCIGRVCAVSANLLNIDRAVLGGGVAAYDFELLRPGIEEGVRKSLFAPGNEGFRVERTALGYHAALLGAAAIALEGEDGHE